MSPAKRLKALINAPEILVLPGVFDGFSTRLVARAGYEAAFITGSGISESRLGQSDVGIMGLDENVAAARAIAACSRINIHPPRLSREITVHKIASGGIERDLPGGV